MSPEIPAAGAGPGMGPTPQANRLLAALRAEDLAAWLPHLRPLRLHREHVLPANQAVFPTTATLSLFASTSVGQTAEVTTVGNEGFVGMLLLTGTDPSCTYAEVTGSGDAFLLPAVALRQEFRRSAGTMEVLLRYLQVHVAQSMQRAVCVHHHSVEQRLCCCLLDSLDRSRRGIPVALMHQSMATRLGVRRESVSACAQRLQRDGVISYQRGAITVCDLETLHACSCPCYEESRTIYERLLPSPGRAASLLPATRAQRDTASRMAGRRLPGSSSPALDGQGPT